MATVHEFAARADASAIPNRWDPAVAATLSPGQLLLYRSNLLGSDKRVTNFGGHGGMPRRSCRKSILSPASPWKCCGSRVPAGTSGP